MNLYIAFTSFLLCSFQCANSLVIAPISPIIGGQTEIQVPKAMATPTAMPEVKIN